ncbi:MAG: hypothetical protein WBB37_03250 [bacterium]
MTGFNNLTYDVLERVLKFVARFGLPMIIIAWFIVFFVLMSMIFVLRRYSLHGKWQAALVVGSLSLVAHLVDFFGTLRVCPDLSFEANPIWCVVVEKMGLGLARWYGFTGKMLLAIISFELFVYYLVQREILLPDKAQGFFAFWRNFGKKEAGNRVICFANIKNFFAFLFALIGPFCLYIALLNSITDSELYMRMPSMPIMLVFYIIVLTFVYLFGNYLAVKRNG